MEKGPRTTHRRLLDRSDWSGGAKVTLGDDERVSRQANDDSTRKMSVTIEEFVTGEKTQELMRLFDLIHCMLCTTTR